MDLESVLAAHQQWFVDDGWIPPEVPGRAILCNADLVGIDLSGAQLFKADLSGADLRSADLEGTVLIRATLKGADLTHANTRGVKLLGANLEAAALPFAKLQGIDIGGSVLKNAFLFEADLSGAKLNGVNFQDATLSGANFSGAVFKKTKLTGAKLSDATLTGALYEPTTAPAQGHLSGLIGIRTLWFCPGESSGLVQLRNALRKDGLRDPEREATYRIESLKTHYDLLRWSGGSIRDCKNGLAIDRWRAVEGAFRLVFFELPTDYGLAYGRPIMILLGLIGFCALFVYFPSLLFKPKRLDGSGIYRIWPEGRIERSGARLVPANNVVIERLAPRGLPVLGFAFYFSLVSAFHLGWRDLNVGTWIARMQPREYSLRAKGFVRIVSGVQSLVSVYLLAMWVLTYFGRPFG